jgi:transcriptional regulator
MVIIWRRFVVWIRTLLLDWFLKRPIQWSNKLGELFNIIVDVVKKEEDQEPIPIKPTTPDYDILPKKPVRDFLRKLFKR